MSGTILVIWTSCSDMPAVGFMPAIMPLGFEGKAAMLKEKMSLPGRGVEASLVLSRRRVTFAEKDGGPGRHVRAVSHGPVHSQILIQHVRFQWNVSNC